MKTKFDDWSITRPYIVFENPPHLNYFHNSISSKKLCIENIKFLSTLTWLPFKEVETQYHTCFDRLLRWDKNKTNIFQLHNRTLLLMKRLLK